MRFGLRLVDSYCKPEYPTKDCKFLVDLSGRFSVSDDGELHRDEVHTVSDAIADIVADVAYSIQPTSKASRLLAGNVIAMAWACANVCTSALR